jgi:uncharacterized ferritin-like protein (DUF455 family)
MEPNWEPFRVDNSVLLAPRPLGETAGVGDRLRTAAFAEVQAEAAFLWAATTYEDASEELREAWRGLATEERKHRVWLLDRLRALECAVDERPVSDILWRSLTRCHTAAEFCHYMAGAEERGRRAGERFHERLMSVDPVTARIFGQIALEERAHIELAYRFYPAAD